MLISARLPLGVILMAGRLAIWLSEWHVTCDVCELNFYDTPHWSLILVPTNPSSKLEDYKLDENIHSVPL